MIDFSFFSLALKTNFALLNNKCNVKPTLRDNFLESSPPLSPPTCVGEEGSGRVVGLYVFPVKSCGGSSLSSSLVSEAGLEWDRQWMVMRGRTVLTQSREPRLAQIKARIELTRRALVLSCSGMEDIEVALEAGGEARAGLTGDICLGKICGQEVGGEDCGEEVSDWLETE